ncbi:hypothetical protein C8A00DRAFT_11349 [Chaetomidium leptoderma]|uniref:Uncharacterized protein n=1 Tax=Chaetomidium leptoderma TaxID=669021 RepID=A0AAN6VU46_9PEZI|nr:hypothetical protein C8A00DRAFT_11349 [Chaetomidium leptoderma]
MLSETQPPPSQLLAESAALLSLLSRIITDPRDNRREPSVPDQDSGRLLPFEREADLAGTFAFLSGISDKPSHVVATCIEELSSGRGIRVVVAVNKEHPKSGDGILARIKSGLERIFRCLADANNASDAALGDQVYDAIIDMCKNRILSRIRSQTFAATYNKKGRLFFGSAVQQVFDAVYKHGWGKKTAREVDGFFKRADELQQRLAQLEACQTDEVACRIKSVLRAAYRLNKATDFDKIFHGFTPRELDSTTRLGFVSRLAKLSRYQECSLYLCQTAREFRLFRNSEVTVLSLDAHLFARNLTSPLEGCLTGCLSRCQTGAPTVFCEEKILAKLHASDTSFRSTVQGILKESRVHAEVQILCYYELHPDVSKPRVICSSKDACYLCNLLIQLHGTFHIPRTHGTLYPGWRLLPFPGIDHVLLRLNQSLEAEIRELLSAIMTVANPELMLHQNVNESTVFPFSASLPSLAGSTLWAEETSGEELAEVQAMNGVQQRAESVSSGGSPTETPPQVVKSQPLGLLSGYLLTRKTPQVAHRQTVAVGQLPLNYRARGLQTVLKFTLRSQVLAMNRQRRCLLRLETQLCQTKRVLFNSLGQSQKSRSRSRSRSRSKNQFQIRN